MPKQKIAAMDEWMDDISAMASGKIPSTVAQRKVAEYVLTAPELYSDKVISWAQETIVSYIMGLKR